MTRYQTLTETLDAWTPTLDRWLARADAFDETKINRDEGGKFAATPGHVSELTKIGPQLGSNPGGQYQDKSGQKFYVKQAKTAEHAANEVLAGHLYKAAGAPITNAHRIDMGDGQHGVISHWAEHGGKFQPHNPAHVQEASKHFATHAWLANWDAIGLENDNQVPIGGKLHTVDAGGAMKFRAMGGKKESFGPSVAEFKTMRDPKMGAQAANVFGSMSHEDIKRSASRVLDVDDNRIRQLVDTHGHGDADERTKFADLLIARKHDLMKKVYEP